MLTINFAMIVAIYYLLNTATMTLKLFSFFAYSVGHDRFAGTNVNGSIVDT